MVAERTVNNNHRDGTDVVGPIGRWLVIAKAFIRSDNANMSKKQITEICRDYANRELMKGSL